MNEQKPATAADLKLRDDEIKKISETIAKEMRLRQWAVEKAVKTVKSTDCTSVEFMQELTQFFYNFVTNKEKADD